MKKLKMNLIFLMATALVSCVYSPKGKSIYFIDNNKLTCREYKIVDAKPKLKFEFVKEIPLMDCDGFVAIKPMDFKEVQAAWESEHQKKDKD